MTPWLATSCALLTSLLMAARLPAAAGESPVWSKNSCGRSVIEFQEAAEALAGLDLPRGTTDPVPRDATVPKVPPSP